jgi:hypothetical protein
MPKQKRRVITVRWETKAGVWWVIERGSNKPIAIFVHKLFAIRRGRAEARGHYGMGGLAQLVVKNKNQRIAFENTYGLDPRRSKG